MENVWGRQSQALQNASGIAMLLNLRGGCRAELVNVAKKFSKPVSFCSAWKVALELVCFRFLLAKASNSARAQNSELSIWHKILTIVKLRYKTWNQSYLLLREKKQGRPSFILSWIASSAEIIEGTFSIDAHTPDVTFGCDNREVAIQDLKPALSSSPWKSTRQT